MPELCGNARDSAVVKIDIHFPGLPYPELWVMTKERKEKIQIFPQAMARRYQLFTVASYHRAPVTEQ